MFSNRCCALWSVPRSAHVYSKPVPECVYKTRCAHGHQHKWCELLIKVNISKQVNFPQDLVGPKKIWIVLYQTIISYRAPKFGIFNIFVLPILAKFRASRTIWRDPVKHTGQNNSEWYRNYPQIRSGGRFLNILGLKKIARKHVFFINYIFKTNYSKPLR